METHKLSLFIIIIIFIIPVFSFFWLLVLVGKLDFR